MVLFSMVPLNRSTCYGTTDIIIITTIIIIIKKNLSDTHKHASFVRATVVITRRCNLKLVDKVTFHLIGPLFICILQHSHLQVYLAQNNCFCTPMKLYLLQIKVNCCVPLQSVSGVLISLFEAMSL